MCRRGLITKAGRDVRSACGVKPRKAVTTKAYRTTAERLVGSKFISMLIVGSVLACMNVLGSTPDKCQP